MGVLLTITIETSSVQGAGELCQCVSKLIGRAVDILQTQGLESGIRILEQLEIHRSCTLSLGVLNS